MWLRVARCAFNFYDTYRLKESQPNGQHANEIQSNIMTMEKMHVKSFNDHSYIGLWFVIES